MTNSDKLLYSIKDAAEKLSISQRVMEQLIHDGHVETIKIGRRRLVPSEALTEYVERVKRAS